jgi:hypothetical protein
LVADITQVELEPMACDISHDRAVFHFLTAPEQRVAYFRQLVAHYSNHVRLKTRNQRRTAIASGCPLC